VLGEIAAYVIDQLAQSMKVESRRMFGGAGLYSEDLFFGLIAGDVLYFKVDDSNRQDYVARGCAAFQPPVRDQSASVVIVANTVKPTNTPEPSDCCSEHPTFGCDNPVCEACVCDVDDFCCGASVDSEWDGSCVEITGGDCSDACPCQ
jgi:TfoX/Sxy family transcriptional regulator of competence genes